MFTWTSLVFHLPLFAPYGRNVNYEPTGPNSTLGTNAKGDQLYPGPGNNAFVDRPPVCTQTSPTLVPANCVPGIVRGGAGSPPGTRTDTFTGGTGADVIADPSILSNDTGRAVELRVAEATGEGLMRWAPNGRNIVAKWDFVVEND